MRTFVNFCLVQCIPGFLPALILKLACDWFSWVFPCLSNIPFQFGHIVLLGDSGSDNCMSQPFCAVWQYTDLLFFQLLGQRSWFYGLKSTSRILQSPSCSALVPTRHRKCIWWILSQGSKTMPACISFSSAFTINYFQFYLAARRALSYWPQPLSHLYVWSGTMLCPWPCPFFLLLFLSLTSLVSCACKSRPPHPWLHHPPWSSTKGSCPQRGERVAHDCLSVSLIFTEVLSWTK